MGAWNLVDIGLSYRPASLCSLANQFQTLFLESIPRPIARLKFPTLGSLHGRTLACPPGYISQKRVRPLYKVRRIRNFFFIRFEANLIEYGSYSLHISMFRYIRKHTLFASFASKYSHRFTYKIFDLVGKNTYCSEYSLKIFLFWRIFASKYRLEANIHETLCEFHIQDNICLQIFAYQLKLQMRLRRSGSCLCIYHRLEETLQKKSWFLVFVNCYNFFK
jgi:hypothetical protein